MSHQLQNQESTFVGQSPCLAGLHTGGFVTQRSTVELDHVAGTGAELSQTPRQVA